MDGVGGPPFLLLHHAKHLLEALEWTVLSVHVLLHPERGRASERVWVVPECVLRLRTGAAVQWWARCVTFWG